MKRALLSVASLALATVVAAAQTAVPPLLSYQGNLTDQNGNPLVTAEYKLTFRIWNDLENMSPSVDNLLWVETYTSVPVVQGHFHVILGHGQALAGFEDRRDLTAAFFASAKRYVSVEVGTTDLSGEVRPRQQLLSTPYALQVERALHGVFVGTIFPYFGTQATPPEGWLYCDGSPIPDESKYAALRAHLMNQPSVPIEIYDPGTEAFHTPDLRGRFFWTITASTDLGTSGGAATHVHSVDVPQFASWATGGNYGHALISDNDGVVRNHAHWVNPPLTNTNSPNHLPPYLRVSFIIKL